LFVSYLPGGFAKMQMGWLRGVAPVDPARSPNAAAAVSPAKIVTKMWKLRCISFRRYVALSGVASRACP
jgi:hypothetical protein